MWEFQGPLHESVEYPLWIIFTKKDGVSIGVVRVQTLQMWNHAAPSAVIMLKCSADQEDQIIAKANW